MATLSSVTLFFCATAANAAAVLSTGARPIRMLEGEHAGGSGDVAYEWAGVFATPENTYTWIAEATGDAAPYTYADTSMQIVLLSVTTANRASLYAEAGEGNHSFYESACVDVASGGTITPEEDKCYKLTFSDTDQRSTFLIDATGAPNLAIFTEHVPTEFEVDYHYLQQGDFAANNQRNDVEPEFSFMAPQTFEWGGIFAVPNASYTWYAQQVVSASATSLAYAYADETMDVVMLPVADDSEAALLASKADADHSWEEKGACTVVNSGGSIKPVNESCFIMTFDDNADSDTSTFTIDTSTTNYVAVWAQHVPTEFERDLHYFKDTAFADVEPAHTYSEAAKPQKKWRWGEIIGAAILVNLMTLAGVVLMVPFIKERREMFEAVMLSFSGGAILSFTFYLILPEAPHYIEGGHPGAEELEVTWRYGSVVLAGYLAGWFADTLGSIFTKEEEKKPDGTKDIDGSVHSANVKRRVIVGCLVGDGLHNLIDGFLIAFAFQWCSSSRGWQIAAATIGHELAQEIADYSILILKAGLKPITALSFNFLSGTTVLLGAIIATAGKPSNEVMGLITAFGGGAYIFIAQESMSRVFNMELAGPKALIPFFAFIVGVVAIATVLVDHQHCSESTAQAALSIAAGMAVDPHGH